MHNTVAHYLLNDAVPEPQLALPGRQISPVYILGMMFCDVEYSFGHFMLAFLAILPPSSSLAEKSLT